MIPAHAKEVEIRLIERWPDHEPRSDDPHYHVFNQARARLKRQGLLKCNIISDYHAGQIELHHAIVEYAHINDIDVDKLNEHYGLHLSDEEFRDFAEGKPFRNDAGQLVNALEPLCVLHHRGQEGVHSLPEPEWNLMRDATNPREVIQAVKNTVVGVVQNPKPAS